MNNEKYLSKAKGLLALIDHANTPEHEKATAEKLLKTLCEQHGIDIDKLREPDKQQFVFAAKKEEWAKTMLVQLAWVISGEDCADFEYTRHTKGRNKKQGKTVGFSFPLTTAQYLELKETFEFHYKQYKKEQKKALQALWKAYIHKHEMFGVNSDTNTPKKEMTFEEIQAVRSMMGLISDETFEYLKKLK